jgi:hypothetical protein
MKYKFQIILIPLSLLLLTQCGPQKIESSWRNTEISIDGNPVEWKNVIQYPTDNKFGIGFMNDEKDLFICMTSWDSDKNRLIMEQGFTLFFKTPSGKGRVFGIHFPCAMEKHGGMFGPQRSGMGGPPRGGMDNNGQSPMEHGQENMNAGNNATDSQPPERDMEPKNDNFENYVQNIHIIGPDKNDTLPMKMIQAESVGLIARITVSPNGNLCYEAKIPLSIDPAHKFAIGVESDSVVNISFETSVQSAGNQSAGGPPSGGGGGMGGGPGGGGMGGGPGGGRGGPPGGGMGGGPGGGGGQSAGSTDQFTGSFAVKLAVKP